MKPNRLIFDYSKMAGRAIRPPETAAFLPSSPDPSHRPTGKSLRLVSIWFEKTAADRVIGFDGSASLSDLMGNAVSVEWRK